MDGGGRKLSSTFAIPAGVRASGVLETFAQLPGAFRCALVTILVESLGGCLGATVMSCTSEGRIE